MYNIATNFANMPFPVAVKYITGGSSRKFQFSFIGDPVLRFSKNEDVVTVEDIVLGANSANTEEEDGYTFKEFRALVEQKKVTCLRELHKLTENDVRLDQFVNGSGDDPKRPKKKLTSALNSIGYRLAPAELTLISELFSAVKQPCVCKGRQMPAVKFWSKTIRWADGTETSEFAAGGVIVMWAVVGKNGGNTLCFTGTTGTGKTWVIDMIRSCLNDQHFDIPEGDGSYGMEQLGYDTPEKLCFTLDEMNAFRLAQWLTNGKPGWWKTWLSVQVARKIKLQLPKNNLSAYDRFVFDRDSPIVYSGTWPLRLTMGSDGYVDEAEIEAENAQQRRRENQGLCQVKVDKGKAHRITPCGHCFATYLVECNKHYNICDPVTHELNTYDLPKQKTVKQEPKN